MVIKNIRRRLLYTKYIRPLSKPIYDEEFLGDTQASTASSIIEIREERNQVSTTKLPSEIEFGKRSISKGLQKFPMTNIDSKINSL